MTLFLFLVGVVTGIRLQAPMMHAEVELGSGAYYALPAYRDRLKHQVSLANDQFKRSLTAATNRSASPVTRGVVVYLPPDSRQYYDQLKWLYLSIGYMRSSQPNTIKTDLLIFADLTKMKILADEFGCATTVRKSFSDPENCIVLPHTPIADRKLEPEDLLAPLQGYAGVLDSILVLAEMKYDISSAYSHLIRTDLDTFLTPGFGAFELPPGVAIAAGRGGYYSKNAQMHLEWIAEKKLDLIYNSYQNIGSTWYGESSAMVSAGRLSVAVMQWLATQEFTEFEFKGISGAEAWPFWYKPVMTMYAGDIALNQVPQNLIRRSVDGSGVSFDLSTQDAESALDKSIQHLHVFQYDDLFSKFRFHDGKYKTLSLSPYLNMSLPRDYATVIAVSSSRLSTPELVGYVKNQTAMANREWVRIDPIK